LNKNIIIINKLSLGGAEEFFCELGKRLSNKFTFAVLENDYSYNLDFDIKKYKIPKNLPRYIKILIKILILLTIKKKYDKIICFDNETGILSYFVNKKKTKLVIHTYLPLFYLNKSKIYSKILYKIYKNSGVISISKTATRGFEELTLNQNLNIPIIYNLINFDKLKLQNKLQNIKPIFFQLTRLEDDKNIKLSLKLIFYLKKEFSTNDIKLLIFGDGSQKDELMRLIKKYDLTENVFLKGFENKPFEYLKKTDIFLNFSNFEGWSRLIHECAHLNIRGITFDCPYGPREILINDLDKKIEYPYKVSNIYLINIVKKYEKNNFKDISVEEIQIAKIMLELLNSKKFIEKKFKGLFRQNITEIVDILNL
tara:strand:+ start:2751 stop:3854 length:1104 start_codon:yes stop_codon:yes gene_type:complete